MPEPRVACVLCGHPAGALDAGANAALNLAPPFGVLCCPQCGLRWLNPMPTADEYRQLYEAHYFGAVDVDTLPAWMRDYAPQPYQETVGGAREAAFRARLQRIDARFPRRGSLLDVGLATGEFAALAVQDGWHVAGLDISEQACVEAGRRGIEVFCADLLDADFAERRFDVIHLSHVFEHFIEPWQALGKLRSLMHDGSLLVIEVPNQFDSWLRIIANNLRRLAGRPGMPRSIWSIHHPYFYNAANLRRLLLAADLEVVWLRTTFPERWQANPLRRAMGLVEWLSDRIARRGENIEIAVRLAGKEKAR